MTEGIEVISGRPTCGAPVGSSERRAVKCASAASVYANAASSQPIHSCQTHRLQLEQIPKVANRLWQPVNVAASVGIARGAWSQEAGKDSVIWTWGSG